MSKEEPFYLTQFQEHLLKHIREMELEHDPFCMACKILDDKNFRFMRDVIRMDYVINHAGKTEELKSVMKEFNSKKRECANKIAQLIEDSFRFFYDTPHLIPNEDKIEPKNIAKEINNEKEIKPNKD